MAKPMICSFSRPPPNTTIRRASAIIATAPVDRRIVQPLEDLPELGQGRAVERAHASPPGS